MKHEITTYNTKRLMAESLKKAMADKPFLKITVSDVVKDCGVNRKTFYYHFQDIYALLKWVLDEEAVNIVKHFDLLTNYEDAISFVMNYVSENKYIISCVDDAESLDEVKRFLFSDLSGVVLSVIESAEAQNNAIIDPEFKEFTSKFYTEAIISMLIDWLKNGKPETREKHIRFMTETISLAVESMILHMQKSN